MYENKPPVINGIFTNTINYVGYFGNSENPEEYTIENPGVDVFNAGYNQKGIFVYTYDPNDANEKKTYGMWKKKFDKNLCFNGWELFFVSSENNNTTYILEPTKVHKNCVCEYTSYAITSGFNNNPPNFTQSGNVGEIKGRKIKKNNG